LLVWYIICFSPKKDNFTLKNSDDRVIHRYKVQKKLKGDYSIDSFVKVKDVG